MKAFYTNRQGTQGGLYPGGPFRVLLGFTMYLKTVPKVKNGMIVSVSVVAPLDGVADWELSLLPLSIMRGSYCIL